MAFEMWNGSVWVTVTLGTRPIRAVNGARPEQPPSAASSRPRTLVRSGSLLVHGAARTGGRGVLDGQVVEWQALFSAKRSQVDPVTARR